MSVSVWGIHAQGRQDGSALIGIWTAAEASGRMATLEFVAGGFFEIEFRNDEALDVAGRYQVVNNALIIIDEGGLAACLAPDYHPGRYAFMIRSGDLTLDAIKDDCAGRVTILERRAAVKRTWTKKK